MTFGKIIVRFGMAASLLAAAFVVGIQLAQAHGSTQNPVSRIYNCFLEGPEHPISAACQAAVAVGGTQGLYDWNGVRQGNANGNHQAIIPDGKLCSANDPEFKGMDLARSDWVATTLPTSGNYTFRIRATAPHVGNFSLYVTKNGYNPLQPLKWSDLESTAFTSVNNPPLVNGFYEWTASLPTGKSGRHLIYLIWQRSDSPEAFYACSDVIFGNVTNPSATPLPPSATSVPPTFVPMTNTPIGPTKTPLPPTRTNTPLPPTPTQSGVPAWNGNFQPYSLNALVTYQGHTYKCIQAHTSQPTWTPAAVPALWQMVS